MVLYADRYVTKFNILMLLLAVSILMLSCFSSLYENYMLMRLLFVFSNAYLAMTFFYLCSIFYQRRIVLNSNSISGYSVISHSRVNFLYTDILDFHFEGISKNSIKIIRTKKDLMIIQLAPNSFVKLKNELLKKNVNKPLAEDPDILIMKYSTL